jgi:archaellum biogenesis ATPase FlaH
MRLLKYGEDGKLTITSFDDAIPPYAILSHTWGPDADEVIFADLGKGDGKHRPGYEKIRFCGEQAQQDGLQYFWVDTCCIDKTDKAELSHAIRSMFRWYQNATRCYVYLSDVSAREKGCDDMPGKSTWEPAFRSSRWFTRGWTLQELLAPSIVEFFSKEWEKLSDKTSLKLLIYKMTSISLEALDGAPLSRFSVNARLGWREGRVTTREEDGAYSLQGILGVEIAPLYGEGAAGAFRRLMDEIDSSKRCVQDLHSTDPRDDKKRIEETKGGLLADSYRWILGNTTFQQWQQDPHSRLLWVKGDPGKGKTMLLCGIIDELQKTANSTVTVIYFFCQATDSRINTATAVLRGLLYMLVSQQPSLVLHVRKKHDKAGKTLFEDTNAWVALSEIFTSMTQDRGLKTTYLVVDALDECVVDLPKLLDLIVRTSTLSPRVKWLVSSRNDNHIEEKLKSVGDEAKLSLELKQNAEQVARAVDAYIDYKLSCLESLGEADLRKQVRDELHRKANGTFLWVALVMQELEKPESWDPLAVVEEAPAGLQQLYDRMMEQIQRLSARNVDICQSLLCTTAVAYRPLYLAEMGSLCRSAGRATMLAETVRKIVAMCGSFLTVRDEQVYLVHQSAKDYLSDKMRATALPSQGEMHYTLFAQSLELLSSKLKRDMYDLAEPGFLTDEVRTPNPDPLATACYSCFYWVDHLCKSKPKSLGSSVGGLQAADVVEDFLKKKYLYWLEALSLCRGVGKGVVSMTKLWSLVQVCRPESAYFYIAVSMLTLVGDARRR